MNTTVVFAYRFLKCDILKKTTFIVHKWVTENTYHPLNEKA